MNARRRSPSAGSKDGIPLPPPPRDLSALPLAFEGEEYAVLSFSTELDEPPASLSGAERDVLRALMRGWTNAEIAENRGTAVRTVANQVQALYRKVGVCSRAELVVWATRG